MTKEPNNGHKDQEDFLDRLDTGDTGGLDDFEKEALEGFSSLGDSERARRLNDALHRRIDEKYLGQESGRPKWVYYSMAAGLALVIGLSILFFNNYTQKEPALAYAHDGIKQPEEQLKQEMQKQSEMNAAGEKDKEQAPAENPNAVTAASKAPAAEATDDLQRSTGTMDKGAAQLGAGGGQENGHPASNGPDLKSRLVTKEQKPDATGETKTTGKDGYWTSENKAAEKAEQKSNRDEQPADLAKKTERTDADRRSDSKNEESLTMNEPPKTADKLEQPVAALNGAYESVTVTGNSTPAPSGSAGLADAKAAHNNRANYKAKKEAAPAESEAPATAAQTKAPGGEGLAHDDNAGGMPLRRTSYFKTAQFANHVDYFKAEIGKNEALKAGLLAYDHAFRIDLTVNEAGKVTQADADLPASCAGCKQAMEKMILSMPPWQPAQDSNGNAVKQTFFFNYKY